MKNNFTKLEERCWFEDIHGNKVSRNDPKARYYHRYRFPLKLQEDVYEFCYHPKNPIIKFICQRVPKFYNLISRNKPKTLKKSFSCVYTYDSGQDCIVAMVNSGDYTLEQAIWVYANSCERGRNSLSYKYLNSEDEHPEFSEKQKKCISKTCMNFAERR